MISLRDKLGPFPVNIAARDKCSRPEGLHRQVRRWEKRLSIILDRCDTIEQYIDEALARIKTAPTRPERAKARQNAAYAMLTRERHRRWAQECVVAIDGLKKRIHEERVKNGLDR